MKNLFDRRRPNGAKVREIKDLVINYFGFPETTVLTVAELRCHDDGCPPVETVITARHSDSSIQDWRRQSWIELSEWRAVITVST